MPGYSVFEIKRALESMIFLVDTREQDTPALRRRLQALGRPWERTKLDVGDYSCTYETPDGARRQLPACVERKMGLDELVSCFTTGRGRFEREFQRAVGVGTRMHLLVENGSWDRVLAGEYRSRITPASLSASMLAWSRRYDFPIYFCRPENTGQMIYKILRYELKELLERGGEVGTGMDQARPADSKPLDLAGKRAL